MFLTFVLYLQGFLGISTFVVHSDGSPLGFQDLVRLFVIQANFMSIVAGYIEERGR